MPSTDTISKQRQQKWAWIWIAYTGFLFITPVLEPSRALWLGTLAVFFLFLGIMWCYIRFTDDPHPLRFWMIAATFLLGLIAFPWNQGASCLFAYAAAFIPFSVVSIRRVLILQAGILAVIGIEGYLCHARLDAFHISWANTYIAIFIAIVVGGGNIFFAQQKRADCLLRAAQEENVTLAAVAERERIARDLHDVLGHTLSVIVLKAELAKRLIDSNPQRAAAEIGDVERTARTALAEVREAIGGYRARGLAAEIEAARRTLDAAGVTLIVDSDSAGAPGPSHLGTRDTNASSSTPLSPQEETVLALALREAVTNIVRHACATTCTLRFVTENGMRRLLVEDNGQPGETHTLLEGNGLRGMRERVEAIGGQLLLQRDRGTRLQITLPLRAEPA
jgi:two-component system sensor histidine kinase DesK